MTSSASLHEKVIVRTPYGRYTWNEEQQTVSFFHHHRSTAAWSENLFSPFNDVMGAMKKCALHMILQVRTLQEVTEAKRAIKEMDDGKDR